MASIDMTAFANELDFNPKTWVNEVCASKQGDEPLERFLAELEMRLQLAAEEIEAGLQESSGQAMRRIPFAVQEIYRLQGDIQGMQDQVKVLASHAARDSREAADSVGTIRQLDLVKRNMESAYSTLKEATELSGMFIKVEDVFASGDLPRVAELLKSMRASLALVGDVPEFRAGRTKLRALEDRLQAQVEGALSAALAQPAEAATGEAGVQSEAHAAALCSLLLAVDRYQTVEVMYVDARLARVHSLWEELAAPQGVTAPTISQWLPAFHARLLPLVHAEVAWAGRVLPGHQSRVVVALLTAIFTKLGKACAARLAEAGGSTPLPVLMGVSGALASAARGVAEVLPAGLTANARADIVMLVLQPLEEKVSVYGSLESAQLGAALAVALPAPLATAEHEDSEQMVHQLWEGVRTAAAACAAAVERCLAFTAGTELPALARLLDEALAALVSRATQRTAQLAARAAATAAGPGITSALMGDASAEVGAALRLVLVAGEVAGGGLLRHADASLRAALATCLPRLETVAAAATAALKPSTAPVPQPGASTGSRSVSVSVAAVPIAALADPAGLRLARAPERLRRLRQLADNLADPRTVLLPKAAAQADALTKAMHSAALDALLARVRAALHPLPGLLEWRAGGKAGMGGGGMALPTFSADPLAHVTAIGEYLMLLPQQLEVLVGDDLLGSTMSQDEHDELAAQWLDKVVAGAGGLYAHSIQIIPELSPQGGVQLAADVEYFCNVMSALHVAPPASLLTVQLFAGMPAAEWGAAVRSALSDGGADAGALSALAQQRRLPLQ